MIIKTKDFILRPANMSDADKYFQMMQDSLTREGFMSTPKNMNEAKKEIKEYIKAFDNKFKFNKLFVIDVNGNFAGYVILQTQNYNPTEHRGRIHMALHPGYRGLGLMEKAINVLVKYSFDKYNFIKICAQCRSFNKGAQNVLKKTGFKLEGVLKKDAIKDGKYLDNMLWAKMNTKIGERQA